jgi:hypothetical protein
MARPHNPQKLIPQPFVIEPRLRAELKRLNALTRVSVNAYLNEAVADLLRKYADVMKSESKAESGTKRARKHSPRP